MLTGTALINELDDELNELKLSTMAATKHYTVKINTR